MPDKFSAETRSRIMRSIRCRDTKPELRLAAALRQAGVRFSRYPKHLPCKVDFWIPSVKVGVFVDGDFWHRCPVHSGVVAPDRPGWMEKLTVNIERDRRNERDLLRLGILPVRAWECEVNRRADGVAHEIAALVLALATGRASLSLLSWAAGFIDGEGSITISRGAPMIGLAQVHPGPLRDIADLFGFCDVKPCTAASRKSIIYGWRVSGSLRSGLVCRWVKCLLRLKRPQAELISVWCSGTQSTPGRVRLSRVVVSERAAVLEAVRCLNRRGHGPAWRTNLSEAAKRSWALRRPREEAC